MPAWQLEPTIQEHQKTKQAMGKQVYRSGSQLDRLFDPKNVSVIPNMIARAARTPSKGETILLADAMAKGA